MTKEKERLAKIEKERERKLQDEVKDCTFKPSVTTNAFASSDLPAYERLWQHSKETEARRKDQVTTEELKEQAELKECTFKPKTNTSRSSSASNPSVRGYNEQVRRLRVAQQARNEQTQRQNE